MRNIVKMVFGSQLYGTNTHSSDTDYKSVYIPNPKEILLQKIKESLSLKKDKAENEKNTNEDIDEEIYSLDKYLKLVGEGQTVSLDMLFAPDQFLLTNSLSWKEIQNNKEKLISKKSKAFIGYCRTQANKYGIKGSRVAAARDSLAFLNHLIQIMGMSVKLGEYASKIDIFVKDKEFIEIVDIPLPNGQIIRHLSVCDRKLPYTSSVGNAFSVVKKIVDEYGKRAIQAEKNEGVDWKALSHAVRIGEQAVELFETHNIVFPRPNAHELLKIKKGEIPYKEVSEKIEKLFLDVEYASEKSTLPENVDKEWIENFIVDIYGRIVYIDYIEKLRRI
jgi:hypothetical protein